MKLEIRYVFEPEFHEIYLYKNRTCTAHYGYGRVVLHFLDDSSFDCIDAYSKKAKKMLSTKIFGLAL